MPSSIEKRTFKVEEFRTTAEGKLVGHAAVFNSPTQIYRDMYEQIAPGAFARALQEKQDVRALFNHDPNFVIGRTKSGTLFVREDSKGLAIEINPPDTTWAKDLQTSIQRGDIDQMSFGFRTKKDQFEERVIEGQKVILRTLIDVDLCDVSPVTFPAYPDTDIHSRSEMPVEIRKQADEFIRSHSDTENEQPKEAGATEGPKWEESQERLDLMKRRVELESKI
jgi:uncharacterized protein